MALLKRFDPAGDLTGDVVPLPSLAASELAVPPPDTGPGHWAGAPSAVLHDGVFWLAYRLRRPVTEGRGYAVAVARSDDGVRFEPVVTLSKEAFHCASHERPALVRTPEGRWRLYLSCSTEGSKHWWVDAVDADDPVHLDASRRVSVWRGDERTAMKDPVVLHDGERWHAWVCYHPLGDDEQADRMTTRHAESDDGLSWTFTADALAPTAGSWDSRGARVSAVLPGLRTAYYDGRASAEQNWFEQTGVAFGCGDGTFEASGRHADARSPEGDGALRYVSVVPLPEGGHRLYFEVAVADGTHELHTQLAR